MLTSFQSQIKSCLSFLQVRWNIWWTLIFADPETIQRMSLFCYRSQYKPFMHCIFYRRVLTSGWQKLNIHFSVFLALLLSGNFISFYSFSDSAICRLSGSVPAPPLEAIWRTQHASMCHTDYTHSPGTGMAHHQHPVFTHHVKEGTHERFYACKRPASHLEYDKCFFCFFV